MQKEIHDLVQGSEAWNEFRLHHHGASEAAAMLGLSSKVKRTELLHMKKSGVAREFSDWVRKNILDHGHEVEALARPLIETDIKTDLYPATCSLGNLSASCDGLTLDESLGWEHKQWNEKLAAAVAANELPDEFMAQPQQCMLVTGADEWIFTVSDGTEDNMVSMTIKPDPAWFERIRAGWAQFDIDLEEYEHVEVLPAAVAAPVADLPALAIRVNGAITLNSNLAMFGARLSDFIGNINKTPEDDQDFADAEAAIKVLERAESALGAAEASALAQTADIDEMCRTVASYKDLARNTRLMMEKLVKARKETVRIEILQKAKDQSVAHIAALNVRLGKPYMPQIASDFAGAMKGKRTISSLRDAADTELARFKIEANAVADKIQLNLTTLRELAHAHSFLFADAAQIVLKANDDLTALVKLRISDHERAEQEKADALRAKIVEEERVKAEAAATEKARLAKVEADRIEAERVRAQAQADANTAPATLKVAPSPVATSAEISDPAPAPRQILAPAQAWPFPTKSADPVLIKQSTPPTLRLGQIADRFGFVLTADFLRSLGFEPAGRDKAAVLYHEAQFPAIRAALIRHIESIQVSEAA